MLYIVAYDLRTQQKDYSAFHSALNSLGECRPLLLNVWALRRTSTAINSPNQIAGYLAQYVGGIDRVLVYDVTGRRPDGLMTNDVWEWLNARQNG